MWQTIEILPSSLRNDPQVISACEAIDSQLVELYRDVSPIAFWPNIDKQVSPLLDVMMWEYHVDINEMMVAGGALSEEKKRQLIDESIFWHQKKGTKWIIERALAILFEKIEVIEWYEYGGNPYFFKVVASSALNDWQTYGRVLRIIYTLKNVRSWLEEFIIARASHQNLWEASVTVKNVTNRIFMMAKPSESEEEFFVGLAVCHYVNRYISAPEE